MKATQRTRPLSGACPGEAFRHLSAVRAALDAVPDPVNGLLVYRGRGGGAGARKPRKPKPAPNAGAVSLPESGAVPDLDLTRISPPEPVRPGSTSRPRAAWCSTSSPRVS